MMIGIGMPNMYSTIERMMNTSLKLFEPLSRGHAVTLPSARRRGQTGAKRSDQKRQERPKQGLRHGSSNRLRRLLGVGKYFRNPFVGVRLVQSRSRRDKLSEIVSICRRDLTFPKRIHKETSHLATLRRTIGDRLGS